MREVRLSPGPGAVAHVQKGLNEERNEAGKGRETEHDDNGPLLVSPVGIAALKKIK